MKHYALTQISHLLWPRLLPGLFDDDPAELFLGIGSVLDAQHARHAITHKSVI